MLRIVVKSGRERRGKKRSMSRPRAQLTSAQVLELEGWFRPLALDYNFNFELGD